MLNLNEYDTIAAKLLRVHAPAFRKNPDFIYNVTHEIMLADHLFDGTGTLEGYRKQRAQWIIFKLIKKIKKKRLQAKDNLVELETVQEKTKVQNEPIYYDFLNDRENKILNLRYQSELTLCQIGTIIHVSKERVRQILCQIHKKVKHQLPSS